MSIKYDILSLGSWAIFDHIFKLSKYPSPGETVKLKMPVSLLKAEYFGDCSANIAAVAAKLGTRVALNMVVGDDFVASGYQTHLESLGVDLTSTKVMQGETSGHNFLYFDDNGEGFCISHLGVAENQDSWQLPVEIINNSNYVVVNEMFSNCSLSALAYAKSKDKKTVINGMVATAEVFAAKLIELTDILFISQSEYNNLLTVLDINSIKQLQNFGPKILFITMGFQGSTAYINDEIYKIPLVPASKTVDPTGAGDAYAAGTMVALIKGFSGKKAAQVGSTVSSFIVEAWGCQTNLPTWLEVKTRYELFFQEELKP